MCEPKRRPLSEPVDIVDLFASSFLSPAGHLLPIATPWSAPTGTRRARGENCGACSRPPRGGKLSGTWHPEVDGELWVCRLCALKLNHGSPYAIEQEEKREQYARKRFLDTQGEIRDPERWTRIDRDRVAFAGSFGTIALVRGKVVDWTWTATGSDGSTTGRAPFVEAVEAAGMALLDLTLVDWIERDEAEAQAHALACEVRQMDALDRRSARR